MVEWQDPVDTDSIGGYYAQLTHRYRKKQAPQRKLRTLIKKVDQKQDLKVAVAALKLYQTKKEPLDPKTLAQFISLTCSLGEPGLAVKVVQSDTKELVHKLDGDDDRSNTVHVPPLLGRFTRAALNPASLRLVFDAVGDAGREGRNVEVAQQVALDALSVIRFHNFELSSRLAYSALRAFANLEQFDAAKRFLSYAETQNFTVKPAALSLLTQAEEASAAKAALAAAAEAEAAKAAAEAAEAEAESEAADSDDDSD